MNWEDFRAQTRVLFGIFHGSRAFGGPFQADLELTTRCNLRCIHCYFYSPFLHQPMRRSLDGAKHLNLHNPDDDFSGSVKCPDASTDRIMALLNELIGMGTRNILFSGGGEPFLHPNALEFMGRAKRKGVACLANTNGTLLTPSLVDELIRIGFDDLRITVMAGTREMYVRTHPGLPPTVFDELRENLLYLTRKKAALKVSRPKVTLVFVALAQNYNGAFEFAEFADCVKADRVWFRPVDDMGSPDLGAVVPTAEQSAHLREELADAAPYLEARGIEHNIPNFLMVFRQRLDTTALYRMIPCYYGWLSVLIEAAGPVYPCCRSQVPLGDLSVSSFSEVWHGPAFARYRREALKVNKRKAPATGCDCSRCVHHAANLKVFERLRPIKARSGPLPKLLGSWG